MRHTLTFWSSLLVLAATQFDLVFLCHPDKMGNVYVPRKTQEVQGKTFIVRTCTQLQWLCQILAQTSYHLDYNTYKICQACTHILHPFLFIDPTAHKHTSSRSVVKDKFLPRKAILYSELWQHQTNIYHISTCFCFQEIFAFYLLLFGFGLQCVTLWYAFTSFMCLAGFCAPVCVEIRSVSVCFTALAAAKSKPIQNTETALCLWATTLWDLCVCRL